ncbi:uncharacterized protein LOC115710555 [Cannabis sativa]|uniref:uncharacterized protein LOC115710555 n=1 Tax=Cannabis sativa TaxID=3483 RepID=UPI0029CA3372|nr:uncharacterized protein LOC115710555 [Cannabis sativa]
MANQSWINKYDHAEAVYLNEWLFDHSFCILTLYPGLACGKKPFKYFRMWKSHPKYEGYLKETWSQRIEGTVMFQKAKITWLQDGDCNTTFFHASIKHMLRQNRILAIEQQDGSRIHDPTLITTAFLEFYKNLGGVWLEDNWETIGDEICKAVKSVLESGKILKVINSTIITLVPKVKCPNTAKDFRPITCCNVIYNIATKLLSSRIMTILPEIISHSQGGFIKGRYIGHNIMICQDLVRHYGRKSNKPSYMIKLDLQKAYDTIEWAFIEEM